MASATSSRVVVTGLGALTPLGNSVDAFWEGLTTGASGIGPTTRFDASDFRCQIAGEIRDFDPTAYVDAKQARRLDRFSQYALAVAADALADAALQPKELSPDARDRIGVIFGTGIGGVDLFQEQAEVFREHGPRRLSPFFVPMMISNMAAGLIAMEHTLRGPNHCVISACATGNDAVADSLMLLRHGHADVMIAGGTEAAINELCVGGFGSMRALSSRNDAPTEASRPFDVDRDGFVPSEGAGALILETLEHAEARGARIYAEVAGFGKSNDAHHYAAPDPDGRGATLAMHGAVDDAGLARTDIDHINMHATSTPVGDIIESKAIEQAFGDHAHEISCSATKSMTGHLLGAAGAVESIATVLALHHGIVPPTINTETVEEGCTLNYTLGTAEERPLRAALANAFGFGGHNTTLAFTPAP
ncbi:beta-ketoacyl-ACP synthase II [Salisaeta longa]|uniref:beta-ketoacyl-ACP synthase II n=1 Tax=Salisaeta longa TaxID=503170 RepID=UPI0003B59856|nr:beta-ketoacyl-ACP synthase II [Salisaeta longa]